MAKYLICIWGLFAPTLMAEVLRDPTLPPAQSGLVPADQFVATPPPMLQSITLGSVTKFAMINGQTVMLGGAYHDWTLVGLSANEAVLRAKDGKTKVLVMDYAMQKHNASAAQPITRNQAAANAATALTTRNNLTERPPAPVRVPTESLWVKQ